MRLEDTQMYKDVYARLATEVEGWDELTEELRCNLVDAELVAP
jgi:hypothetical protein